MVCLSRCFLIRTYRFDRIASTVSPPAVIRRCKCSVNVVLRITPDGLRSDQLKIENVNRKLIVPSEHIIFAARLSAYHATNVLVASVITTQQVFRKISSSRRVVGPMLSR
jgi:hypothetical protein